MSEKHEYKHPIENDELDARAAEDLDPDERAKRARNYRRIKTRQSAAQAAHRNFQPKKITRLSPDTGRRSSSS